MTVIKVIIELKETSQPIELAAKNTYTKGLLYCIQLCDNAEVQKFPLDNIWRIKEDYS